MLEHAVWVLQEQLRMFVNEDKILHLRHWNVFLVYDLRGEIYGVSLESHIFSGEPKAVNNMKHITPDFSSFGQIFFTDCEANVYYC